MPTKSPQLALCRICVTLMLAAVTLPLVAGRTSNPWDQTDWKQWTAKDVRQILSKSPWVVRCCQGWLAGGESSMPGSGTTAIIVSSQIVREALVRQLQMEKRYTQLDPARRREIDQRIDACLDKKFDTDIVFSFSLLGNWKRPGYEVVKASADGIRVITSDGRKVAGQLVSESTAMTCGAFPEDNFDGSISQPFGTGEEVAFPRFVAGKPTIGPQDKTIRIDSHFILDGSQGHSKDYSEFDFKISKLTHQGKPDF